MTITTARDIVTIIDTAQDKNLLINYLEISTRPLHSNGTTPSSGFIRLDFFECITFEAGDMTRIECDMTVPLLSSTVIGEELFEYFFGSLPGWMTRRISHRSSKDFNYLVSRLREMAALEGI